MSQFRKANTKPSVKLRKFNKTIRAILVEQYGILVLLNARQESPLICQPFTDRYRHEVLDFFYTRRTQECNNKRIYDNITHG
jgi:hypothetical protein